MKKTKKMNKKKRITKRESYSDSDLKKEISEIRLKKKEYLESSIKNKKNEGFFGKIRNKIKDRAVISKLNYEENLRNNMIRKRMDVARINDQIKYEKGINELQKLRQSRQNRMNPLTLEINKPTKPLTFKDIVG